MPLFGTGALGRATVEMWQGRLELELLAAVAAVFRHTHPGAASLEVPQIPTWGEVNKGRVALFLERFDRHLADRDFVCGAAYTIADITGLIGIDFMKPARLAIPDGCDHVRRWHAAVSARPSASA